MTPHDNDEVRARTIEEQQLARVGIPAAFWDTALRRLSFRQCLFGEKAEKLLPAQQRQALRQVSIEPRKQLIVLGGFPSDAGALAAGYSTLVQAHHNGNNVSAVNAEFARNRLPHKTNLYLVHNIMNHASSVRLEGVRDLIVRWKAPAKVVVVGQCKDPYSFAVNRLCLRPDAVGLVIDPK